MVHWRALAITLVCVGCPTNNYYKEQIIRTIRKCNCFQKRRSCCWAETLPFPTIRANSNPLAWWKADVGDQPKLSAVAKKYLCIPATTAPLERVFSSSGPTVKAKHSEYEYARISASKYELTGVPHFWKGANIDRLGCISSLRCFF